MASIVAYAVFMSKSSEHVPDGMEGTHSVQVLVVGIIAAALLGFAILSAAHKILSPLVKFWSSLIAHTLTGSIACKNALRSPARMVVDRASPPRRNDAYSYGAYRLCDP